MWVYYSVKNDDMPMTVRSGTEISLLAVSAAYILRNKWKQRQQVKPEVALPT